VSWGFFTVAAFCVVGGATGGYYLAMHKRIKAENGVRSTLLSRVLGVFLVLLAFGTAIQTVYFQKEQESQANCQYRVNAALIQVLNARSDSVDQSDEALKQMAQSILDAKDRDSSRVAIQNFINKLNDKQKQKTDNPLPTFPNDCVPK